MTFFVETVDETVRKTEGRFKSLVLKESSIETYIFILVKRRVLT